MSRTTVLILAVVSAIFLFFALIVVIGSARRPARPARRPRRRAARPRRRGAEARCWSGTRSRGGADGVPGHLLPFLYLREPVRQRAAADKELTESVRLGKATFEEFCSRCHGPGPEGGTVKRYVTPGVKGPSRPTSGPRPARDPQPAPRRGRARSPGRRSRRAARPRPCRPGASATAGP